jgi:hypothetical protein
MVSRICMSYYLDPPFNPKKRLRIQNHECHTGPDSD